jgi:oxygen-independent coproporphyrinogen-3 oxidase
VARVLDLIASRFQPVAGAEVTLEANPEDVTPDAARAWRAAGINRVSLGAQTFHEPTLAWMHRGHGADRIERAVGTLHDAGIVDLSVDLIFSLPEHLGRDWTADIDRALALDVPHLSLYGLTIEPHTPLGRWRERGDVAEAPEEHFEREFLDAHYRLGEAGFEHYEVSNYARPAKRARHNSSYWSRRPYAGLGPSAHSFDGERRRWNVAAYAEWAALSHAGADPIEGVENLSDSNRRAEEVYLGLRTRDGLVLDESELEIVRPWIDSGWAELDGSRLRLTPTGWMRLDALAAGLTHLPSRS